MNLSAIGQKLITGLREKNQKAAKTYIDKIREHVDGLNKLHGMALKDDSGGIRKIFEDDIIVRSCEFDLFDTKFVVDALFSEASSEPRLLIIKGSAE